MIKIICIVLIAFLPIDAEARRRFDVLGQLNKRIDSEHNDFVRHKILSNNDGKGFDSFVDIPVFTKNRAGRKAHKATYRN